MVNATIEELRLTYQEMTQINMRREERVHHHEMKAARLFISYIISQVLIFYAISGSGGVVVSCGYSLIPFSISMFSTVLFFMLFPKQLLKYFRAVHKLELKRIDEERVYRQIHPIPGNYERRTESRESLLVKMSWRLAYMGLTLLVVIAIAAVMLFACLSLPCDSSHKVQSPVTLTKTELLTIQPTISQAMITPSETTQDILAETFAETFEALVQPSFLADVKLEF